MMSLGPASMGNAELLAILLRGGTKKESALEIGHRLLAGAGGSLARLFGMSVESLCRTDGIGPCKAAEIRAAFELGKRFMAEKALDTGRPIVSARMVYDIMSPVLHALGHEECWVLYLDAANRLLTRERQTSGGLNSTVIDPHAVVRRAIEKGALGIILVHNHPSGNPCPSPADIKQTRILHNSSSACNLLLLDHIIVSQGKFFSFSDDRLYEGDDLVLAD